MVHGFLLVKISVSSFIDLKGKQSGKTLLHLKELWLKQSSDASEVFKLSFKKWMR